MSALTAKEQQLYDAAKAALPSWLFAGDDTTETVASFAKQMALVWSQIDFFVDQTFILRAIGAFLDDLAKDRGTRRQHNETDAVLADRLHVLREDAVTVAALRLRVRAMMADAGLPLAADYNELVEVRRDGAFIGRGPGVQFQAVAAASILDGETYQIENKTYEFRKTSSAGINNVEVNIASATTAATVAAAMVAAMTAQFGTKVNVGTSGSTVVVREAVRASEQVINAGFTVRRKRSYIGRGYRISGPSLSRTVVIFILPYGTTQATADSIAEALRQIKAGGVKVLIERRLSP